MELLNFISLISLFAAVSARIYSFENADGSYTVGHTSDSRGQSANSVLALLTKGAGYTTDGNHETQPTASYQQPSSRSEPYPVQSRGLLGSHMEILQLIEVFLKFKGELGARLRDLMRDNYDLIRSVYQNILQKIGNLHAFTLMGVKILRKILEFAVTLMVNWQVSLPPVSLGLNVGSGFGASNEDASMDMSTNFFNNK
ncbi:hypothetical protein BDFB_010251 [Asbolus verrucosus]|uniref:Uncharacterized protein n=1 Tax=Asbolus verrucosus TaxID=1661398 RepID=A0A482V145_ASBVE|nr:hypothetical protein BDFB_010251 [Asbolus verrucosus]